MAVSVTADDRTAGAWRDFGGSGWRERVDVRDFIQANYTPYEGDASFLTGPTDRTRAVWETVSALFPEERSRGVLDVDTATPSTITSHAPGWIDHDRELIVGLQTDAPLKRAIMPNGGLRTAFTGEILRRCKEAGLHTALDTSGFLGARASDELLSGTDLVLLDIIDSTTYRRLTGGELTPTLNFANRLDRLGVRMWIRYVLVPGWTDDAESVEGLADFVAGLGSVDRVDVLPFHKLGASKYEALGLPFPLRDTPSPAGDAVERVRERFRAHGLAAC